MTVSLSKDKFMKIINYEKSILVKERHPNRVIAKLVGLMVASFPTLPHGQLYFGKFEIEKSRNFTRFL